MCRVKLTWRWTALPLAHLSHSVFFCFSFTDKFLGYICKGYALTPCLIFGLYMSAFCFQRTIIRLLIFLRFLSSAARFSAKEERFTMLCVCLTSPTGSGSFHSFTCSDWPLHVRSAGSRTPPEAAFSGEHGGSQSRNSFRPHRCQQVCLALPGVVMHFKFLPDSGS